MSTDTFGGYLDKFANIRALVIGDVMLDRFVYGTIDRISPESDAPVLDIHHTKSMPGGAGNVVKNLRALGITTKLIAVCGDDESAAQLAPFLDKDDHLIKTQDRPTTTKTRYIAGGKHLIRVDEEKRSPIKTETEQEVLSAASAMVNDSDIIILSDYNKGVLSDAVIKAVIQLCNKAGKTVLVDPKKTDATIYKGASLLTPNRNELADITGITADNEDDIVKAAQTLQNELGLEKLVVTRSEDGISVFERNNAPHHIKAINKNVTDVSGAGDTVIAALAACLATGAPLKEAAEIANKAAGLAVMHSGTSEINETQLRGALDDKAVLPQTSKQTFQAGLEGVQNAAKIIASWKQEGLRVGFTNGCFDILHYGHVSYLNRTRDKCDKLVIGLNHDQSINLLKGPERPLHDEQARATVIGALGCVDLVVLFGAEKEGEDNTPCALIKEIKPDIYFKGGDYTIDQLPEAKIMEAIGGTVELMPLYEGHSTTSTIEKMKKTEVA